MAKIMDRTEEHRSGNRESIDPCLMVVAIDFGTSYSGYAFSTKDDFLNKTDNGFMFQPSNSGCGKLLSYKTPTSLLLNKKKEFEAFGYEAENKFAELCESNEGDEYYFFEKFKMSLYEGFRFEEMMKPMLMFISVLAAFAHVGQQGGLPPFLPTISPTMTAFDFGGKELPAVDVFSLSIKAMVDDFMKQKTKNGLDFINSSEIKWVLTVPAIWGERAKNFMRKCAVKAGIADKNLRIALEPECASIYCQSLRPEQLCGKTQSEAPHMGSKYIVVDIGGGTVDIAVHQMVGNQKLKELCKATGGACGGTSVDTKFLEVLTTLFGEKLVTELKSNDPETFLNIFRSFELLKRSIQPDDSTGHISIDIQYVILSELCMKHCRKSPEDQIKSSEFSSNISIYRGHLKMQKTFLRELFSDTLAKINSLIEDTFADDRVKDVNTIVLVGGFAECILVQHSVQTTFPQKRVIIPNDCGLAVLKGALMFGHQSSFISLRVLPFTIGLQACKPYNENLGHTRENTFVQNGKTYSRNLFHVILEGDTEVEVDSDIVIEIRTTKPFQKHLIISLFATKKKNLKYINETNCWFLGRAIIKVRTPSKELHLVKVVFSFGNTEIKVHGQGEDPDKDDKYEGSLDLLSENENTEIPDIILED